MADDLRTRIEVSLAPHVHNGHLVDAEIGDVVDAVLPVVQEAIHHATVYDCCGQLLYGPHTMACPRYVGPVDHWRVHGPDGDVSCTCGWSWPAFGEECDNAETWRGPLPDEDTP